MIKFILFVVAILITAGGLMFYLNQQSKVPPVKVAITKPTPVESGPTDTPVLSVNSTPAPTIVPPTSTPGSTTITPVSANAAVIKTNKGDITITLYPLDAPRTVTNFATLAKYGYYNNLLFHRVVADFVIQGGDPKGDGTGGTSIYGPIFEDELNPDTQSYKDGYKEGVVAMANRGANTNGSQFFIMLADHPELPKNYTIFGKVTAGLDVVHKIQVGDKMLQINLQ